MKIYKDPGFAQDFPRKTPMIEWGTRAWMENFISWLGEQMFNSIDNVEWETDLDIIPGVEESGWIPFTDGGLRLVLTSRLEAEADYSHYPSFPCVRKELDSLSHDVALDFERVEGIPVADAEGEQYWEFVDSWNEDCDAYVEYVFEIWQGEYEDKVHMQAYISLDDERTAVRRTWYVGELPDPIEAVEDLIPVIMAAWERKI